MARARCQDGTGVHRAECSYRVNCGIGMASDLVRSIHAVAKQEHEAEQKRVAEQSAAVLHIQYECLENIDYDPDESCTSYNIHKSLAGELHLSPSMSLRKPRQAAPGGSYKFHHYNQAVGEFLAAQFLTDRETMVLRKQEHLVRQGDDSEDFKSLSTLQAEAWHGISILVFINKQSHPYYPPHNNPLMLRCAAETFPRTINAILQAYLAGSFI